MYETNGVETWLVCRGCGALSPMVKGAGRKGEKRVRAACRDWPNVRLRGKVTGQRVCPDCAGKISTTAGTPVSVA